MSVLVLFFSFFVWRAEAQTVPDRPQVPPITADKLRLSWTHRGAIPNYFLIKLQKGSEQPVFLYTEPGVRSVDIEEKYALEGYRWSVAACKGTKISTDLCSETALQTFDLSLLKTAAPAVLPPEKIKGTEIVKLGRGEYFKNLLNAIIGWRIVALKEDQDARDVLLELNQLKAELDKKDTAIRSAEAKIQALQGEIQTIKSLVDKYANFKNSYASLNQELGKLFELAK